MAKGKQNYVNTPIEAFSQSPTAMQTTAIQHYRAQAPFSNPCMYTK